ncbi:hypothetical protein A4G99_14035 [Haladaptatus sp. R4]|nr:LLM class flavin-dependent oxidoreductase [Haladaptatus sp. R4]KZN23186.1 hypothetical protein A4G99_14035 [Haladaptatus sp. R4]
MQFDWMVQCYAGAGVHRDAPLYDALDRDSVLAGADAAVESGLGGLWAPDHFMLGPRREEFEVWTLLSALAERTDDVDLGPLVGSITYRNPALLAKMATTVDILSEGRLRLGLGAGWHEAEHAAYGFDFPDVNTRIDMLEETIQILRAMFTEDAPTFHGNHYDIEDAYNEPKPVQEPYPPLVVGGAGPRMLRLAARYADEWNVEISARARGKPIEFKVRKFDEYCRRKAATRPTWSARGSPTSSSARTRTNCRSTAIASSRCRGVRNRTWTTSYRTPRTPAKRVASSSERPPKWPTKSTRFAASGSTKFSCCSSISRKRREWNCSATK